MSDSNEDPRTRASLTEQNEELRRRLEEAQQTLEAIRHGDVDALVMSGPKGEQIYSLTGAEHIYRVIVETMNEAALTMDPDGTILFCNQRFCDLMKTPMHEAMGQKMTAFIARPQWSLLKMLLASAQAGPVQQRLTLRAADGVAVPVQLSASLLQAGDSLSICLVASDLTELEKSANSISVLREHDQEMQEANTRLQTQSEELHSRAEEFRVQTEELRATEAMLRESEQRLALALSGTGVGMYDRDLATGETLCTEPVARFLGLRPTTTTTTTTTLSPGCHYKEWARRVYREDLSRVEAELRRCMAERIPYEGEYRVVWPNRSVHWVADRGVFEYGSEGQCTHMLGVMMDITERKQTEEALRESEEQFHRLFEDDLTGNFISTPEGEILLCNPAFAAMFGFSRAQDVVGTNMVDLYLDPKERDLLVGRLKKEGKIERVETWRKRRDGEPIHVVENRVGHFNKQGQLYEIKGYLFEDTQRKRAEEALRESEGRFRSVLDNSQDVIYRVNLLTGEFEYISPSCQTMVGYSAAELMTFDAPAALAIIHPDDLPAVRAVLARLEQTGTGEAEYRQRAKSGEYRWISNRMSLTRDADGRPLYRDGNIRDITDRKRAEGALWELNATLETRVAERTAQLEHRARQLAKLTLEISETEDRERKRMAEILHDDLQQQLAAAKFHVGILRSRARHDASLQEIAAEVDHMLKGAIEKSRSLSHELSPAVMHHGDFGETAQWLAGQVQAKHGLVIQVDAHGEVRSESEAIKGLLYKTVQEFLFNVVKHARVNEARIRVRRFGRSIYLSVSDRGRGFDPQGLQQAAGFGGRMKIRSVKDKGSTFSIIVPDGQEVVDSRTSVVREEQEKGPADRRLPDTGYRPPLRVLLADDHELVRQGLRSLLSDEHDVEVVGEAANGREAVDLAGRLKPDVIIMDMSMPLIEGDDATRQIKAHLPKTRVIAISMYDQSEKIEAMYRAGAERYVLKTAPSEELLAAIRGEN